MVAMVGIIAAPAITSRPRHATPGCGPSAIGYISVLPPSKRPDAAYIALMFEVILYAAIATVICVAFYSVLGKSVGRGPEDGFDPTELSKDQNGSDAQAVTGAALMPDASDALVDDKGLVAIARAEPGFSPAQFTDGAKTAYSMILEAFASGDRETLQELLTEDVYAVYDAAITERDANTLTQVTDLGRLRACQIKESWIDGKTASIRVLYEADIASALRDADGNLIEGDPDMLASISEFWTYERELGSNDPTWRLAEVEPSEGDELAADPTPDTATDPDA